MHASEFGPANRVPNLHEPVRPPGSQAISLWTPGQGADPMCPGRTEATGFMGLETMDLRSLFEPFDHTNRPVLRAGGQIASVRAPRHRPDRPTVGGQGENFLAAGGVPDPRRAVQATRCQVRTSRTPRHRADQPELLRD